MDEDKFRLLIEFIFENAFRKGYKKGLKKGKSIGSHQTYNKFVKHGHWVNHYDLDGNITHYECTNCDFGLLWANDDALPKYCPECGARMDGDDNA